MRRDMAQMRVGLGGRSVPTSGIIGDPKRAHTELPLTRTGAKLLDFNIASRVGDQVRTRSGTPPYQPPDANLTRWDVSPDLFAVGVVLYQLLCDGHHPYPNSQPMVDEPVIDPTAIRSDLDPNLAEFLAKACASSNADRFPTAVEMQLTLRMVRADL
jgi:serine/threonine protein kinase